MRFLLLLIVGMFFCVPESAAQEVPEPPPPVKKSITREKVVLIVLIRPVAPILNDPNSVTTSFQVDSVLFGNYVPAYITLKKSELPVVADDLPKQFVVSLGEKPPTLFYRKAIVSFPALKIPVLTYHPVLSYVSLEREIKKKPGQ